MKFDFLREGLNILGGIVVGLLIYIIAELFGANAVAAGAMTASLSTTLANLGFALGLAGGFFGDVGAQVATRFGYVPQP